MNIDRLTPDGAILKELGTRLTRVRKQQGQSQEALAREAGLGVATLRRIENGSDGQLGSWLKILKALGLGGVINSLLPEDFDSPMDEVLSPKMRRSKRAGKAFKWGDESS